MKLVQNTKKAGVILGFMTMFPSETLQIIRPPLSTQVSPGNENPVKGFVAAETLSMARSLGPITTKPIMKCNGSKANLHTKPCNSRAVTEKKKEEQWRKERRSPTRGTLVIQASLVEAKRRCWLPAW